MMPSLIALCTMWAYVLTLFMTLHEHHCADSTAPAANVAFVFAGSPRSFQHPPIYLSLRHNLIAGFCPPLMCHPFVFIRMSFSDNSHDGIRYSAKGILIRSGSDQVPKILVAAHQLCANVTIARVDIGSQTEKAEMDAFISKSAASNSHKIYRDLDPRRYSMYFNRMSAYEMARSYELANYMQFDWVVHARLDFFFGERVRPFNMWSRERMWVTDQWMYDVPDVLALMPRNFSDVFYSLEALYENPRVPCLGGPDFDNGSVEREALLNRSYSSKEIEFVNAENCLTKFAFAGTSVLDKATNHRWSTEGISEVLLRRKLKAYGISLALGTLGYSTFFAVMVRDPLAFVCPNSKPSNFIGWVRKRYRSNAALAAGCFNLDDEFRLLRGQHRDNPAKIFGASCDPVSLTRFSPRTDHSIALKAPCSACLVDAAVTHWNFMPFRLKSSSTVFREKTDLCLTFDSENRKKTVRALPTFSTCNDTSMFEDIRTHYELSQLFYFYPHTRAAQRISHYPYAHSIRYCLTVDSGTGANGNTTRQLVMNRCEQDLEAQSQLFQMEYGSSVSGTSATNYDVECDTEREPERGPVMIRWIGQNKELCIGVRSFARRNPSRMPNRPSSTGKKIVLQFCNQTVFDRNTVYPSVKQPSLSSLALFLERAINKASTTTVPPVSDQLDS
jgi:hypothetical protein